MESKVTKEIWFTLTQDEIVERAKDAAKLAVEIRKMEVEAKEEASAFKRAIDHKEKEQNHLMEAIRSGREARYLACDMRKNFEMNLVSFYFEGKLVDERPMTPEERQMEMQIVPADGGANG